MLRSRLPVVIAVAEVLTLVAICAVSAGCGALLSLRPGVLAAGALAAALAIAGAGVVPVLLTTLAPWTAGRVVRSRRQLIAALAERNRRSRPSRPRSPSSPFAASARGSPASSTTSSPTTWR